MSFRIIADSSCDIFEIENKPDNVYFNTVPFVITVDGRDYVDNEEIDVHELVAAMASSSNISSNLSGSYNSACTARQMILENDPDRNIEILDSRGTGPSLNMIIDKLNELIGQGLSFEEVKTEIHKYMEEQGYALDITDERLHHEIYLSDARKVAQEKLKTVIRHPIRKI